MAVSREDHVAAVEAGPSDLLTRFLGRVEEERLAAEKAFRVGFSVPLWDEITDDVIAAVTAEYEVAGWTVKPSVQKTDRYLDFS